MNQGRRVVYTAKTLPEAQEVSQILEEAGIRAVVLNDSASDITFGLPKPVQVLVDGDAVEAARLVLQEMDREADTCATASGRAAEAWPLCPACGAPRAACCQYCGTVATSAASEDAEASVGESGAPLFVCPTCDEPQAPHYAAQCQACGHRFSAEVVEEPPEPMNGRVVLASMGIVALMVAILAYLIVLFQS